MTLPGAVDTVAFVVYVGDVLGPSLHLGPIVLLDNPSVQKARAVRDLIAAHGCRVLYLPSYSPDFSPSELAFAEANACFRPCGYPLPAES